MRIHKAIRLSENEEVDITADFLLGRIPDKNFGYADIAKHDSEAAADELALEIQDDPISFDAAKLLVATHVREGRVVPFALREWCSRLFLGEIISPKLKGKPTGATHARDKMIYQLIDELTHAFELKPTSADRDEGKSACHAVATAFSLLGLNPRSHQAILEIWQKRSKFQAFSTRDDW